MPAGDRGAELIIYRMGLRLVPTETEQQAIIDQFSPGLERRILRPTRRERLGLLKGLGSARADFEGLSEAYLARFATARYLTDFFTNSLTQRASRQFRLGNNLSLAFHIDVLVSTFSTFDAVTRTDLTTLSGGPDAVVRRDTDAIEQITGRTPDLPNQVNRFFAESDLYVQALRLLREDPTGRLLIAEAAKGIRDEETRYGNQPGLRNLIRLFTSYGSILAEQAYNRTHRLNKILRSEET
jgi:hypothetical protein